MSASMATQSTPQPRPGSDDVRAGRGLPRLRGMTPPPPPPPVAARPPLWENHDDATRKAPLPLPPPRPRVASVPPPFPIARAGAPLPRPPTPAREFNPFDELNLDPDSLGPRSTVDLPFARPTMPDMMSAPPPPALQPQSSLARQAARLDRSEFETEAIPVARLGRLRRNRRLGWLMTGLVVAGLAGTVAIGLEERQRLIGELKSAKLSRIETEHAQVNLIRQLRAHDDATAEIRASLAKREADLNARGMTTPESLSLVERLRKELDKKESDIEVVDNTLLVSVSDKAIFSGGKAELSSGGERTLAAIAAALKETPGRRIVVNGHTDDKHPSSRAFPSNWELSALRAIAVVRYLVEEAGLDPAQIAAQAHAQFQPRSKRSEKNRRIELRLEPVEPVRQPSTK